MTNLHYTCTHYSTLLWHYFGLTHGIMLMQYVPNQLEIQLSFFLSIWCFGYTFKDLWFNKNNKTCLVCIFLGKNINMLLGNFLVDKTACLFTFSPADSQHKMVVIIFEYTSNHNIWLGHGRQIGHMYYLYDSSHLW